MKIAITGSQGVGKTTIINELKKNPMFNRFTFKTNILRDLKAKGFKINELGDDKTQIEVCRIHCENLKTENLITDRCIIDCFVFTENLFKNSKVSKETYEYVKKILENDINKFNKIFYIRPEFKIIDDGVRNTDSKYLKEIQNGFERVYEKYKEFMIPISGTVEERLQMILKNI